MMKESRSASGHPLSSRRATSPLLALALLAGAACSEDSSGLDAGVGADVYQGLPDARVFGGRDAGPEEGTPPTVTRVTPSSGSVLGGTRVTLRGSDFEDPAGVWFGAVPATNVVVIDANTLAATSPAGSIGPVSLRVETSGGSADLPDAFTYVRELRLDAVSPQRIPDEGGAQVTLTGKGFSSESVVLFDRTPLRGMTVVDAETITGYTPALSIGRPEVRVITRDAAVRRTDVAVVYGTPDIDGLSPGYGPIAGGTMQEVLGEGLSDAQTVQLGAVAATGVGVLESGRLSFVAPALSEGIHAVEIANPDASGRREGVYVAYDPSRGELHVVGVSPARAPVGTAVVTVVGGGFGSDSQVSIGNQRLLVRSQTDHAIRVELPSGLGAGTHTLDVTDGRSTVSATVELYAPMTLVSISPSSGPASGGTQVTLTGTGFDATAVPRIGGVPLTEVVRVSDSTLSGRTVAGSHGPQDVTVRQGAERATLAGAFTFSEPFELVAIEPVEGSIAGNTYVSIIGRGLTAPSTVSFGGVAGLQPTLENGSVLAVRTPPHPVGTVDVDVTTFEGSGRFEGAFAYFDPRLIVGGAWGGSIEGAVNVAVIDYNREPVPDMTVQLGYDADPRYRAITDENGMATVSRPEVRGAQTITVAGDLQEAVTFIDLDARNLTVYSQTRPQSMAADAPLSPCPTPAGAPVVTGRIYELKSAIDPTTSPNIVPEVRITYSESGVFSPNPPFPLEQTATVTAEGQAYQIVVMRVGTVSVYAILGDLNTVTQEFIPRKMGIVRNVPVAPDTVVTDIDIALTIDMDQIFRVRLDDPPSQTPGPGVNAVFPFLNVGSDGVIPFTPSATTGTGEVVLRNMPDFAESQFYYWGGSFTQSAAGLGAPFSVTLLGSSASAEEGVDLGPFLEMPTNVRPKAGELLANGEITWDQGGPEPDLTTLSVSDVAIVSSACCADINMNGQCEDSEPVNASSAPAGFNRWSMYGPGARESYALPRLPLGVKPFDVPSVYGYTLQLAIAPRFSWKELTYSQLSRGFWRSWVAWTSSFSVKEETD